MVHSRKSTGQWIKSYDFRKMTRPLKTSFLYRLQRQKWNQFWGCLVGILPLRWIPKTWITLLSFHRLLIQPHPTNSLEVTEFWGSTSLLNSIWNRMAVEWNWTLEPWIDRNSGSPEYHFGRQLSQLSDGPLNSSKRLAIGELWQSETQSVAESAFLGRLHLPV